MGIDVTRAAAGLDASRRTRREVGSHRPTCATKTRSRGVVRRGRSPSTAASTASSPRPVSPAADRRTSLDRDEWQRVLDINLTGTFLCAKHAIAHMLEQDAGRRRARQRRHDRERRRSRRHRRRQLVQRVEGRGRDLHQEPRDRLRPRGHSRQRDLSRASSRRRCSTACSACRAWKHVRDDIREEHKLAPPRPARGDRGRRARSSCRRDASFVTGQAIAVDGGYTAGRDHGVTEMFGI